LRFALKWISKSKACDLAGDDELEKHRMFDFGLSILVNKLYSKFQSN
jgi:hypothetical protein